MRFCPLKIIRTGLELKKNWFYPVILGQNRSKTGQNRSKQVKTDQKRSKRGSKSIKTAVFDQKTGENGKLLANSFVICKTLWEKSVVFEGKVNLSEKRSKKRQLVGGERHFWGEESHYFYENGGRNREKNPKKSAIFHFRCPIAKKTPILAKSEV